MAGSHFFKNFALAYLTKAFTKNSDRFKNFLSEQGDNLQLLFLCLAVIVMFASEGKNLLDNPLLLAQMFIPLLIFFAVLFFVAQIVGKLMKFPKKDTVALNMTTLARNSPPFPWRLLL
jgi:ACR3 family arsenite efflux pump ArsB